MSAAPRPAIRHVPDLSHLEDHELRELAALANVWQLIDSAKKYGLVEGGPGINVDRCDEILAYASARGVVPSEEDIDRITAEVLAELAAAEAAA